MSSQSTLVLGNDIIKKIGSTLYVTMTSSAAGLVHYALLGSLCDVSGFKSRDFGLPLRCDAIIYQKAR